MKKSWQLPRRTFLKGLGTAIGLPMLEAMIPPVRVLAAGAGSAPKRMAFIYLPNGMNMEEWTPSTTGVDYAMPATLQPLTPHRKQLQVLSGLAHTKARANGDGAGDHARANATFLTGVQARKTAGSDIRAGVSVDQVAAGKIGKLTRFPSLELSCDRGRLAGECDSGYSCAYQFNIAWKSPTTPLAPEIDPRHVFERFFSAGPQSDVSANRAVRERYRKSVLDFVLDDAKRLQANLGTSDKRKVDEYLSAVRELETRIENAEKFAYSMPDYERPAGIPKEYEQHIRLMYDLLALSFQTDSTRISTFMVAHDGSNRPYPSIGVAEGHHDLSHHGKDPAKLAKIAKINRFHTEQFAYFLEKLKAVKEGEGTLLDNCMIVYGAGIADGNAHAHHDLPVLLAGGGGGTLTPGRHVRYAKETPMTNLFLAMLERMGSPVERFGDSTGVLRDV